MWSPKKQKNENHSQLAALGQGTEQNQLRGGRDGTGIKVIVLYTTNPNSTSSTIWSPSTVKSEPGVTPQQHQV